MRVDFLCVKTEQLLNGVYLEENDREKIKVFHKSVHEISQMVFSVI